jgi:thiamine biosynthesis lipoprotein
MSKPPAFSVEPQDKAAGPVHRFAFGAMASVFEVIIAGQEQRYARQAAEAASDEVERLERELSRFNPSSDTSQIGALKPGQYARVGVATMECLTAAARVHAETGGAFDVTVGALAACFRGPDGKSRDPPADELAAARRVTGMHLLDLRPDEHTVGVKVQGVKVDLGGIGKGYAVDQVIALLREWSIDAAVVSGGTSSVMAIGAPPGQGGWRVALRDPEQPENSLGTLLLKGRSLSGSAAPPGRPHILDPRTGRPATGAAATWAAADSATLTDCLSTAFMVLSPAEVGEYCARHPAVSGMLLVKDSSGRKVLRYGKWDKS